MPETWATYRRRLRAERDIYLWVVSYSAFSCCLLIVIMVFGEVKDSVFVVLLGTLAFMYGIFRKALNGHAAVIGACERHGF